MSHHLSGPHPRSPSDDARLDLTDLFVFPSSVRGHTVLIMNVNPFAPARGEAFHPDAVYRVDIDTDGDNRADLAYSFVFSEPDSAGQTVTVHRATGEDARRHGAAGEVVVGDAAVAFGPQPNVVEYGPYRLSAGLRSDPFFADLDGILDGLRWTGVDFGAGKNVFGIALEIPDSQLGEGPVGVWARVSVHRDGELVSVDRGAHPLLTAWFNEEGAKDAYGAGDPADDWETYRNPWCAVLERTGGYSPEEAEEALRAVLPDVLRYDRTRRPGYPNGRTLTDDVTSARLAMVTGGRVTDGRVGPHRDLLPDFPYLGTPHPAW